MKKIEDIVFNNQENPTQPEIKREDMGRETIEDMVEEEISHDTRRVFVNADRSDEIYKTKRPKYKPLKEETRKRRTRNYSLLILFFGVIGAVLFLSPSKASITITPKTEEVTLTDFRINSNSEDNSGYLNYIVVDDSVSQEVSYESKEERNAKASGTIIVYNDYSTSPQKLIATTRFETPEGKIYMIEDPITVPGKKTVSGETVPGSIEVEVFAEMEGMDYNIGLTDFTLPGLISSDKYDHFYARSKTPMTGGYSGEVYFMTDAEEDAIYQELVSSLKSKLEGRVSSEIPEDYIVIDEKQTITYSKKEDISFESDSAKKSISIEGSISVPIVDKKILAKNITASEDVISYEILAEKSGAWQVAENEGYFTISGLANIVYVQDTLLIRKDVLGKSRKEAENTILSLDQNSGVDVKITPFWKRKIPQKSEKVDIEIKIP
ncbi:hypothetical protein KC842_00455 [Candidatus Nomurabacteria bacterium]|nr:hypothetical protein [Candidatus Nomurabacteria bacterium]USN94960.1 MAG: hypothetical protein H6791_00840 [Candidatus Nomurabacteria bacterium]